MLKTVMAFLFGCFVYWSVARNLLVTGIFSALDVKSFLYLRPVKICVVKRRKYLIQNNLPSYEIA